MSEKLIVRHCAPTLAGIKTANLFSVKITSKAELYENIRAMNKRFRYKGLCFIPLSVCDKKALIYVFRPKKLKEDFSSPLAAKFLLKMGYTPDCSEGCGRCICLLRSRLVKNGEFPHEIGLFLGYPPADVKGFIENNASCEKCVGCWKVYSDVNAALKTFSRYKKCTEVYNRHFENGASLDKLTVKSA